MNISPSWILLLILVAGLSIGIVWFSNTSYAAALRGIGVPVPYCTFMRPTTSAELDFTAVGPGFFYGAQDIIAFLSFKPSDEVLTSFCSASENGANVRFILSPLLSKDSKFLEFLDRCKIKYRAANVVLPNLAVSDGCVLLFGYDKDVVVCEGDYASRVRKYLEGVWRG